jgi:hypothetical protein
MPLDRPRWHRAPADADALHWPAAQRRADAAACPAAQNDQARVVSECSCETSLCRGRIGAPASVIAIGHMEWAGSAARIER